jgi:hypothetical protein
MFLPSNYTLEQAIAAAHDDGVSMGSQRSGIFEVQNDKGIYSDVNYKSRLTFRTWEQLETEEIN